MNPIKTFVDRPILTLMLIMTLVVFGLYSYPSIGVDQLPNVDIPVVTVTTILPGADPETVERTVTDPLEESLNTLAGLDILQSFSLENVSRVVMRFELERDVDVAAQDVRDKVQAAVAKLPSDAKSPVVEKLDLNSAPVVTLSLAGALPVERLTKLTDDVVKPSLQQITGVGAVDIVGGQSRQLTIVVDPIRLRGFGLTAMDVASALKAQHLDVPGGRTAEPGLERTVKLVAEAHGTEELRDIILGAPQGTPVRLRDVADVVDGPAEARSLARRHGQGSIGIEVRKQSGANTVKVSDAVMSNLERIAKSLPEGAKLEMVQDGSKFIRRSISSVQEDLLLGGLFAVAVVLLFLRNWRSTLISAVALPTSVVGTLAVMSAMDFTFNLITMVALTLSIGLLIDDAIVVIENIVRHMEEGKSAKEAAVDATKEIAMAVLAVTLAVVAVFVPVAFMHGMVGRMFYQFGVTVVAAVAISYLVSMSLTPSLAARVLREHRTPGVVSRAIEWVLGRIESVYRRSLAWVLAHRLATMVGAVGVLGATLVLAKGLNFSLIPEMDQSSVSVLVEMPSGSRVEDTQRELVSLARQIEKIPGVESTFITSGGGAEQEVSKGSVLVSLVDIKERTYSQTQFKNHLRTTLSLQPGVTLAVADGLPLVGGVRMKAVEFNLRSHDWEAVQKAAEKTRERLKSDPHFADVDLSYRTGKPQLDVVLDRDRASALGIAAAPVGLMLRSLMSGDKIADFREGNSSFEIKMKLPAEVLGDAESLGSLQVRSGSGQLVEIRNIGTVRAGQGATRIERQSQVRQITVMADLRDFSLSQAQVLIRDFAARELPPTVQADFGGSGKELDSSMVSFALALALGIALVYIILAAQFESLVHPLSIMMALPLAIIGAIGALLLANEYMSIFGMIGVLMLMGLVTKNGILLIEFTNQLREKGRSTQEALLEAGPIRLRPILMTTVAMIAGMVPVALAKGEGAEMRVAMAIAVIGGLITSTFLTLAVVPVVYSLLDGLSRKLWTKPVKGVGGDVMVGRPSLLVQGVGVRNGERPSGPSMGEASSPAASWSQE